MTNAFHNHLFEVYIPVARAIPAYKKRVIDVANGLTIQHSIGMWRGEDGQVLEEPVYIYRWTCGDRQADHGIAVLESLVDDLLAAGEEAVYCMYNGQVSIRSKS